MSGPNTVNGQRCALQPSAIASMMNEATSCEPLSQPSVAPIMSPRPVLVR